MTHYTGWMGDQPQYKTKQQQAPHSTGHHAGIHPEDVPNQTNELVTRSTGTQAPILYDDWVEPSRSNTRLYTAFQPGSPQTIVRVTEHQGPPVQRASRLAGQIEAHTDKVRAEPHRHARLSLRLALAFLFLVLTLMLLGWLFISALVHLGHMEQDTLTYGMPRTYQMDRDVGHGGVSHFTVENLHGHILIMEILVDDPSKAKIYVGPVLGGQDADVAPATLTFQDVNGDGTLDMILTVENTEHVYPNGPNGFQVNSNG